jgi:hypothetical protein
MHPFEETPDLFTNLSYPPKPHQPTDYLGCRPPARTDGSIDDESPGPFTPEGNMVESRHTLTQSIPPPPPDPSMLETPSPYHEQPPFNDSTANLTGVNIAFPLPTPPMTRPPINLHLPSFQLLGIAAPNPYDIQFRPNHFNPPFGLDPQSLPNDAVLVEGQSLSTPFSILSPTPGEPLLLGPSHSSPSHKAVQQYVLTQTPPDDRGTIHWSSPNARTASGMESEGPTSTGETTPLGNSILSSVAPSNFMNLELNSSSRDISAFSGGAALPWLDKALPTLCMCNDHPFVKSNANSCVQ